MVFLNEWLPNPVGTDTAGEFIELYNGGNAPIVMRGWVLKTESGKKFSFTGGSIPARGYLLAKRSATKLSLRNTDGGLALYDANGALIDQGNFQGSAPEGQSFSRIDRENGSAQHFAFTDPTPGAPNKEVSSMVSVRPYPAGVPLNHGFTIPGFFVIMMGTAALIAGLVIYVIKTHEDLSQLFF